MKAFRYYLSGLGVVAVAGLALSFALSPADRFGLRLAVAVGVAVQGPLGWWLVRSLRTPRFIPLWVAGMGTRVALMAVFAFGLVPAFDLPMGPTLLALVAVLLALLVVEVLALSLAQHHAEVS